jgi:hypothetical protein
MWVDSYSIMNFSNCKLHLHGMPLPGKEHTRISTESGRNINHVHEGTGWSTPCHNEGYGNAWNRWCPTVCIPDARRA